MKGLTSIGVGIKNLSEETLGLGYVGVASSFVASQWFEEKMESCVSHDQIGR